MLMEPDQPHRRRCDAMRGDSIRLDDCFPMRFENTGTMRHTKATKVNRFSRKRLFYTFIQAPDKCCYFLSSTTGRWRWIWLTCQGEVLKFCHGESQDKLLPPTPRIFTASDSMARIDRLLRLLGRCYRDSIRRFVSASYRGERSKTNCGRKNCSIIPMCRTCIT